MKKLFLLLAVFGLLFTACEKGGDNINEQLGGGNIPDDAYISLNKENITFASDGGSIDIKVYSNYAWTLTNNCDWVTTSVTGGEASKKGTIVTLTADVAYDDREGNIIFSCGKATKVLEVSQSFNADDNNTIDQGKGFIIEYTTADGMPVTPNESGFDAKIIRNEYIDGKGYIYFDTQITAIGERAFYECISLTSITIPDSVTSIGNFAFYYCISLKSITIPDGVTSIGERVFYSCSSLTSVTIGDGVTSIGEWAFSDCTSLTSITIGNGVTKIGGYAFYGCTSLTSITIPDGITSIGEYAFFFCTSLSAFYGKFASDDNRCLIIDGKLIFFAPAGLTEYSIPDSVTTIGESAFSGCTSLESITIPDSVIEIGGYAFSFCTWLTSITIGNGVTKIGEGTFCECTSLTSITIPDSVTYIGESAFANCNSLTSITIGKGVTAIGEGAFNGCAGELIINSSKILETIDSNSYGVDWLKEAKFTKLTIGNSVEKIGNRVFYGCTSLTSVTIGDGVRSIGAQAFKGCTSMENITIPYGVREIGGEAFQGCESLISITIPDSVVRIGECVFTGCHGELIINSGIISYNSRPSAYPSLGDGWLYGARFHTITIGEMVTSIGNYVFYGCSSSLRRVNIHAGITSIGDYAFYECKGLTEVYCKAITPPAGGELMFPKNRLNSSSYSSYPDIYVPRASFDAYNVAEGWSTYSDNHQLVGYDF